MANGIEKSSCNILLIWGPGKDEMVLHLRDSLISLAKSEFSEALSLRTIRSEIVVAPDGHDVKVRPAAVSGSFQKEMTDQAKACHAAIVLVGEDIEMSMSRGNVWLERSFWIGLKGDHNLVTVFVCVSPNNPPDWSPSRFGDIGFEHLCITEEELVDPWIAARQILSRTMETVSQWT